MSLGIYTPVMGVDPGVSGAASVLNEHGFPLRITPFRSDMTETEVVEVVRESVDALKHYGGDTCYFEKVGFIRGDGGKGSFTFGLVNGLVRGALRTLDIRICLVPPMVWQSRMQCLTGGNKNVSKNRAKEMFPGFEITHSTADSLLIARYGWEMEAL